MTGRQIVVLGGGPAGAATAVGLARLGERVVLVGEPRRFAAVEGVSARVIDALRGLRFTGALSSFAPPSPRCVTWNGVRSAANQECLVDRQRLDHALLDDVERLGIAVVRGRIADVAQTAKGYEVEVEEPGRRRTLSAHFLVEARGRAAPAAGLPRVRGVETVSLLQYWQGPPVGTRSAVQSVADGWAWMAALADGRRYLQLTVDVASAMLPVKKDLAAFCAARFRAMDAAQPFLYDAEPVGAPHARTSTPVLSECVAGSNWIRVGDAAMAVDPLSGNGIFQTLSSALQAPAVVATLLHNPVEAELAERFHQDRIEHLFYRFARTGRDFYAQETHRMQNPFWKARLGWPDAAPLHVSVTPDSVRVARRPVVHNGRIVEDEVVVTSDQPLGVWHLDGFQVAPLLRLVRESASEASPEALLEQYGGIDGPRATRVAAWMRAQGWIA
jgi:flavin-dependent dehydrogenase